jgi:uncharacterized protein (TIGR02594 family)
MIPDQYKFLQNISTLPKVIAEGLKLIGTKEVVGNGSNAEILSWRDELNSSGNKIEGFSDDDIPWCGLFVAIVCLRSGKDIVESPLWARNWAKFGKKSSPAKLGDVLTFVRPSGGHVGFYIAEDDSCYHVLGGNQSNAVTITRIEKSRLIASRNKYNNAPESAKPYFVTNNGIVSKNEK